MTTDDQLLLLRLEAYQQMEAAIAKNELPKALAIMKRQKATRQKGILLSGEYSAIQDRRINGEIDAEEEQKFLNQLRSRLLNVIELYQPEEVFDAKAEAMAATVERQGNEGGLTYARKINGAEDPVLHCPQEILGRETQLDEMLGRLEGPARRSFQLLGPGGIGKTDFCKVLLQRYLVAHPERAVFWIEVEYLRDIPSLLAAIAQALGLSQTARQAQIVNAASASNGLFYLDNLESLSEDETLPALLEELRKSPNTQWLASTRQLIGSWAFCRIDKLDIDHAVQVFLNQWHKNGGEVLQPEQPLLRQFVAEELGGHPLSLILLASRGLDYGIFNDLIEDWRNTNPRDLAQRLSGQSKHRLDSLDDSLALSLEALKNYPKAIRLWALCAFFPDGMDAAAFRYFKEHTIAGPKERALLIQRSILKNEKGRLMMLPPFARFMHWRLEAKDDSISEQQLFEDGLGFAKEHMPRDYIIKGESGAIWLQRLPFVFQFMYYFSKRVNQYPGQLAVADYMLNQFSYAPFLGKRILEQLLDSTSFSEEGKGYEAQFQNNLGELEFRLGNNEQARALWLSAIASNEGMGSDIGKANSQRNLGVLEFRLGNNERARELWISTIALYEKIGDDQGKANSQRNLGGLEFRLGNNEQARTLWSSAMELYEQTGDNLGKANSQSNLGELEFRLQNNEQARVLWLSAMDLYERTGSYQGKANCQSNLGELEFRLGNNERARELWSIAMELYERTGDDLGKANSQRNLGELEFRLEENEKARKFWESAIKLYEKTGSNLGKAICLGNLADLELKLENYDQAIQFYQKTLRLEQANQAKYNEILTLKSLANCYTQMGFTHHTTALNYLQEALQKAQIVNNTDQIKKIQKAINDLQNAEEEEEYEE
ncbi:MAG: tetratricopeptide repeat protein [Bacteroidota bacterium]